MDFEKEFKFAVGEIQLKPHEFWDLTYSEFADILEGFERRQTRRVNELIYVAWHTAVFSRQKEIPSLDSLMKDSGPQKEQTEEEMVTMCKILNAAFGGEVIEV